MDAANDSRTILSIILTDHESSYPKLLRSLSVQSDSRWEVVDLRRKIGGSNDLASLLSEALLRVAGEVILIAPRDATLRFDAVSCLEGYFASDDLDVLYSDDEIDRGSRRLPRYILKPVYSPERLRSQFYIGDSIFYRAGFLKEIGIAGDVPGAELYDLALRTTSAARRVEHTSERLLRFPAGSLVPGALTDASSIASVRRSLDRHLAATGGGVVLDVSASGVHTTQRSVTGNPLVSIVIPTRASYGNVRGQNRCMVVDAVTSVIEKSSYANFEVIVVIDEDADEDVVTRLREVAGDRLKTVWWHHPFSFSAKVNYGVYHSSGEFVLFLNDDIEVISEGWIEAMLSLCQIPGAGMTGAMLYFEDETVQHAGHLYEANDAGHIGAGWSRGSDGPQGAFLVDREVSGVTAACSIMPRSVFDEAGGFSLLLPNNFNDVDLCMKVNQLGYQIYWSPFAELYHFESKSRVSRVSRYEVETTWSRWESKLDDRRFWPYGILEG